MRGRGTGSTRPATQNSKDSRLKSQKKTDSVSDSVRLCVCLSGHWGIKGPEAEKHGTSRDGGRHRQKQYHLSH